MRADRVHDFLTIHVPDGAMARRALFGAVVFGLTLAILGGGDSAAGAWTRAEGEGFASQTVRYYSTEPNTSADVDYARASLGLYAEYGVTERLTLGFDADQGGRLDEVGYGAQDGRIGGFARVLLWTGATGDVVSAEIGASTPLSGVGAATAPGVDDSDEIKILARYGRGVETPFGSGWTEGAFGFSRFLGPRADEFRLDLTFGVRPSENWVALAQFFGEKGRRNADFGGTDFDLGKLQLSVGRRLFGEKTLLVGFAHDVITRGTTPGYEVSLTLWSTF